MWPLYAFACVACCLLVCLPSVAAHGHLPRAYLPPSKNGSFWGNSNRPDVQSELQQLADRLLQDSPLWPPAFRRVVVNASTFGALPDDGKDDWEGLNSVFQYACNASQQRLALYREQQQLTSALPPLPPQDPNSRPVLVELRFDPGQYDLAAGVDGLSDCAYLLLNGQNATIATHFEQGFSPHRDSQRAFYTCSDCTYTYVYNFVMTTALPATTIGRVTRLLLRDGDQRVVGFEMAVVPHHTAWNADQVTIQHVEADGAQLLWDQPFANYDGYPGPNSTVCNGTAPESVGGCMRIVLDSLTADAIGQYLSPGLYMGAVRGYRLPTLSVPRANTVVLQNIRSLYWNSYNAPFYGRGGGYIDIIDVHDDRVYPEAMLMWTGAPVGQTGFTGTWRIWHYSHETDRDDLMDDMASNADVMAIDRSSNSVTLQIAHGRWAGCHTGYGGFVNETVELGHFHDPFNPYATLTIKAIRAFLNRSKCGNEVSFHEPIPDEMQLADLVCGTTSPALLHFKNIRAGNHIYNQWNVKAHSIILEDSYLYNSSMAGFDVSSDVGYWYEGPRANNILIKNNVFERMNGAIAITPFMWRGPDPTEVMAAPSATHNVTIVNNIIWANETTVLNDWYQQYTIDLHAITNLYLHNNSLYLTPGMRRDHPLIRLCNIRDAVISSNRVFAAEQESAHPGIDCDGFGDDLPANGCEPFPASHVLVTMTDSEDPGCRPEFSWNVTVSSDNSWVKQAGASLNRLQLLFGSQNFRNSSDRMNRLNLRHSPPVLPSYQGVQDVADFRGNSDGGRDPSPNANPNPNPVYIDLLSHWNGAVPPTDGLMIGSQDWAMSLQFILPSSSALVKGARQSLLSIGGEEYERLDMELLFDNSTSVALQARWTHNDSDHLTRLTGALQVDKWTEVELVVRGGAYVNSTLAVCQYRLLVASQSVDVALHQPPPKMVIPSVAAFGRAFSGAQPFTGLLHGLTLSPLLAANHDTTVDQIPPLWTVRE